MKRYTSVLINSIVAMSLLAGINLVSCQTNQVAQTAERVVPVKVQILAPATREISNTYTGSLEGERQAVIYAKLAEAVERVFVKEGETVRANQPLIGLDKFGPTTRYTEAQSVYLNAEKNFKKMEFLYEEGAIAESQFDGAKTEYEVAKAGYDAVLRLVEPRSPIAGVVTAVNVSAGDFVTVGQALATVATPGSLRVKFGVNADEISSFSIGAPVFVTAESVADTVQGKVVAVARSADPQTRAFQIEVNLENPKSSFRPGLFVRVGVVQDRYENVLIVPRASILPGENSQQVWVVQNGRAASRTVSLGKELDGEVVVVSGLTPGDTVVTLGQNYLEDGTAVKITGQEQAKL